MPHSTTACPPRARYRSTCASLATACLHHPELGVTHRASGRAWRPDQEALQAKCVHHDAERERPARYRRRDGGALQLSNAGLHSKQVQVKHFRSVLRQACLSCGRVHYASEGLPANVHHDAGRHRPGRDRRTGGGIHPLSGTSVQGQQGPVPNLPATALTELPVAVKGQYT